jgi:hypothetical protein
MKGETNMATNDDGRTTLPGQLLFDDQYTGPRWRYGLPLRPLSQYANSEAGDFIVWSNRPHPEYPHGSAAWPRELPARMAWDLDLVLLGKED